MYLFIAKGRFNASLCYFCVKLVLFIR